jgi:hypothetical protein
MSDLAGPLTRASGLVATVVLAVALVSGFLFSARETGARRRPAWWLDLHQGLGGLALAAIGVHVVASLLDSGAGVGIAEALVPGIATTDRMALTWGVLGLYLLAGAVFTTWPRRLANRRLWRVIHVGSTVGVVLALVHGYQMGTDASRLIVRVGLVALVAPITYAVVVRAVDVVMRSSVRSGR